MPLPLLDLEGGVHLVEPRLEAALGGLGAGVLPAGAGRGGCRERAEGPSEAKVLPPEKRPAVGHILALLRWSGALGQPQEEVGVPLPERLLAGPTWPLLLGWGALWG